ncbi:septum formation family protein [Myceligenerans indicum]|uniref:Septum formation-related domain-containing protein n=1 Tax=Myceligenerans indicum TaxID=2593663 RepID=A0ABS1LM93_9MICO|nr:septum formation family protein [Myceligenerans indicum]MBL0887288.1 hypothetical protein [Myceligenerans indicum]
MTSPDQPEVNEEVNAPDDAAPVSAESGGSDTDHVDRDDAEASADRSDGETDSAPETPDQQHARTAEESEVKPAAAAETDEHTPETVAPVKADQTGPDTPRPDHESENPAENADATAADQTGADQGDADQGDADEPPVGEAPAGDVADAPGGSTALTDQRDQDDAGPVDASPVDASPVDPVAVGNVSTDPVAVGESADETDTAQRVDRYLDNGAPTQDPGTEDPATEDPGTGDQDAADQDAGDSQAGSPSTDDPSVEDPSVEDLALLAIASAHATQTAPRTFSPPSDAAPPPAETEDEPAFASPSGPAPTAGPVPPVPAPPAEHTTPRPELPPAGTDVRQPHDAFTQVAQFPRAGDRSQDYAPGTAYAGWSPEDVAAARRRRRRSLTLAGAAVAGIAAVAVIAGVIGHASTQRGWEPVAADIAQARDVNSVQLVLGSCIDRIPLDGAVNTVRAVPCDSPHEAQVVGRTDFSEDAVWPGDDDAERKVAQVCGGKQLSAEVRSSDRAKRLRYVVWTPSESSWDDGDRIGLCIATSNTALTETLLD